MAKFLLISGSPRPGNTEFVLKKVFAGLKAEKELILLRQLNINRCKGCLSCDKLKKCVQQDDMQAIYPKTQSADVLIIGSPNYFDNVPGLMKDFIDRTNPFYETDKLKNKKVFFIVVGGGKVKNSQRVIEALKYFADAHQLKVSGIWCFKALHLNDIANSPSAPKQIKEIIKKIKSLSK